MSITPLLSIYIVHKFRIQLVDNQFNPNGYVEKQPDKTTYFMWKEVN